MVIAYFKLATQLAPILDANGWAVNTRAIINIPFGKTLLRLRGFRGTQSSLVDPFAEKERPWNFTFPGSGCSSSLLLWQKGLRR